MCDILVHMLIIHSFNINQEASSVENISLFIRAVNKPSRREEKAPKGAYNKEELRQIETRGTANETMTLSHLWCWELVWYRYTAGRHLCTLHWQPGYSLCIWLGCRMRANFMLEISSNQPSLIACPGLMWCATGLRFYYIGDTDPESKLAIGNGHLWSWAGFMATHI